MDGRAYIFKRDQLHLKVLSREFTVNRKHGGQFIVMQWGGGGQSDECILQLYLAL